jgi:hypothetical protein
MDWTSSILDSALATLSNSDPDTLVDFAEAEFVNFVDFAPAETVAVDTVAVAVEAVAVAVNTVAVAVEAVAVAVNTVAD